MINCLTILLFAFGLDILMGDPVYKLHPVRLTGILINGIEKQLFRLGSSGLTGGVLLTVLTICTVTPVYLGLRYSLSLAHGYATIFIDIFVLYSCMTLKDMLNHVQPIIRSLESNNLERARTSLQKIVGRNTEQMDRNAASRATVESISESFVDGFFAPVFWFILASISAYLMGHENQAGTFGVTAALIYRIINTLDSMVGYRNEKYKRFGKVSAKLDDVMNYLPARGALLVLGMASYICGYNTREAIRTARRDRLKHASPNSAHTESFVAGALGLKLGGPGVYSHGIVEKPWIGNGSSEAGTEHIISTCKLITHAGWISITLFAILLWIII